MGRIARLLDLLRRARALEKVPVPTDEPVFREWVIGIAELADDIGDQTASEADDRGAKVLWAIARHPQAWDPFYGELLRNVGPNHFLPDTSTLETIAVYVQASLNDVMGVFMILAGAVMMEHPS